MARRPYIFCRYEMSFGEERLDAIGQFQFFGENQGQFQEHPRRGDRPPANAVIMEPQPITAEGGYAALSFYIGYQPGFRLKRGFNSRTQKRTSEVIEADDVKEAHIVVVPGLGAMAIEDRTGEHHVPHRTAVNALRSIVASLLQDGDINVFHLTDAEVRKIIESWDLIQYDYTVRPLNPIKVSDFSEERSEAMKRDKVAVDAGRLRPSEGDYMVSNGGLITETQKVVDAGYGQSGGRAVSPLGHEARFPKPDFHMDKQRNFDEREKPRYLKVLFDELEDGSPDAAGIAATLMQFYGDGSKA